MKRPSRQYLAGSDLAPLTSFVTKVRSPLCLADNPSPGDPREILALPGNQARTRLWLDERGEIIGYGVVDHFDNILFDVADGGDEQGICGEILDWAEEAIRIDCPTSGPISLDTTCRSEDSRRIKILNEKGYAPTGLSTIVLVRNLRDGIPRPVVPEGWRIRPVRGEAEADALVALHRAAFGTDHLTLEERLSWMRAPHYMPALDLVLETAAGDLAGYCMCGIERDANEITGQSRGYTDPVAVHPRYRGVGAAKALISLGMRLLAEDGMTEAVLNTSSENLRMLQVASSLGYVVESTRVWYSKLLAQHVARRKRIDD
jgi:ribosomal protein S18 acetylase RimI-like enzyme